MQKAATGPIVASIGPGEPLTLAVDKNAIVVAAREDEYLGRVEPKLASRLIRLMNGGNRYQAAVIRVKEQGIAIIIREIYRHPSLHDVCSFPFKGRGDNRVYLGESLMRYIEDSELDEDEEEGVVIDRGRKTGRNGKSNPRAPLKRAPFLENLFHRIVDFRLQVIRVPRFESRSPRRRPV